MVRPFTICLSHKLAAKLANTIVHATLHWLAGERILYIHESGGPNSMFLKKPSDDLTTIVRVGIVLLVLAALLLTLINRVLH